MPPYIQIHVQVIKLKKLTLQVSHSEKISYFVQNNAQHRYFMNQLSKCLKKSGFFLLNTNIITTIRISLVSNNYTV